jgi:tRNA(Ile)-lysidine synthase
MQLADFFNTCMETLGPWEPKPHLAVMVSGGSDSMALALLSQNWAAAQQGKILALIINHGLRAESAQEAAITQQRLMERGIPAEILHWEGKKPEATAIQQTARAARYRLVEEAVRRHGIWHVLTAHHAGDQRETRQQRQERGSHHAGQAGMAGIRYTPHYRLLRPLLGLEKQPLQQWLLAQSCSWVEDPSNHNPAFQRVRVRQALHQLPADAHAALSQEIAQFGQERHRTESHRLHNGGASLSLHPAGWALLPEASWSALQPAEQNDLLMRLLTCIRGLEDSPRYAEVARLAKRMHEHPTTAQCHSLHGCLIGYHPASHGWLVMREAGWIDPAPLPLSDGLRWDNRFIYQSNNAKKPFVLIKKIEKSLVKSTRASLPPHHPYRRLPARLWHSLPCLLDERGEAFLPYLNAASGLQEAVVFSPHHPFLPPPFFATSANADFCSISP